MKKKIVNYAQIVICSIIIAILITVIIGIFGTHGSMKEIINHCVKIVLAVLVTAITVILLREVKLLNTDNETDKGFTKAFYVIVVILSLFLVMIYNLGDYKSSEFAMYAALALPFIVGLVHYRYGIAASVTIAGVSLVFNIGGNYFLILGLLLSITLASYIVKIIFFTKWSGFIKEENEL